MHKKNKVNKLSYYAKILIVASLTFLLYGLVLDLTNDRRLFDPIDDVEQVSEEESTVTITTSDGSEVVPGNVVVDTEKEDGEKPNFPSNETEVSNSNNQESTNNKSAPTPVSSLDEVNNNFRNQLQKEFGITIKYGLETDGYSVGGFDTNYIQDGNVIYDQLNHLKNTLSLYPSGFFNEIKNGGIPLSVYLVYSYSNQNITGVTDSSYTYAVISIAAAHPFEESFYHESYHYIERYLFKRGANFNTWDAINPQGFTYGVVDYRLSYTYEMNPNAPFVNDYAQTAATEDRASTFEYMMAGSKASCLNKGTIVNAKASQMALTMDAVLNTVSPNVVEYWERFL